MGRFVLPLIRLWMVRAVKSPGLPAMSARALFI